MGDRFQLFTAFSRQGPTKVYVQHRIKEQADRISRLLKEGAYFYVCGDALHMAREVMTEITNIIAFGQNITQSQAEEAVKELRKKNRYQENVWS
ncbi:hypothetical protein V2G26_019826 [Clonostachys chloroleuca]